MTQATGADRATRLCACGCGELVSTRRGQRYVDQRHRQRAYRDRLQAQAIAAGLPGSLTVETLADARFPRSASRDAPARRNAPQARRSQVFVVLPDADTAEQLLDVVDGLDAAREAITAGIERRRRRMIA